MDILFDQWLEKTRQLQITAYGTDPTTLEGAERADFVTWNFAALVVELGEMMQEFPTWKPWVTERGSVINRDKMVDEMVDVLHFAANILSSLDCTDQELNTRYNQKMSLNLKRQEDGYDGVTGKGAGSVWTPMHGEGSVQTSYTVMEPEFLAQALETNEPPITPRAQYPATRNNSGTKQWWNNSTNEWEDAVDRIGF